LCTHKSRTAVWECCRGVSNTPGEALLYIVDPNKAALDSGFLCFAFLLAKKRLEGWGLRGAASAAQKGGLCRQCR
jgi:hypothetical protein